MQFHEPSLGLKSSDRGRESPLAGAAGVAAGGAAEGAAEGATATFGAAGTPNTSPLVVPTGSVLTAAPLKDVDVPKVNSAGLGTAFSVPGLGVLQQGQEVLSAVLDV